jgi:hypothetical protein
MSISDLKEDIIKSAPEKSWTPANLFFNGLRVFLYREIQFIKIFSSTFLLKGSPISEGKIALLYFWTQK